MGDTSKIAVGLTMAGTVDGDRCRFKSVSHAIRIVALHGERDPTECELTAPVAFQAQS